MQKILRLAPEGLASVSIKDRPRYRQAILLADGITYNDLATATQKSPVYIGLIINDLRSGYKVRPLIAKILGYEVDDLWPDSSTIE